YKQPVDRLKQMVLPRLYGVFGKSRRFHQEFWALRDISFNIKRGETVGIIGRNGAGKSTLLQIITGVLSPTSGSYEVSGKVAALLELGAGFNPEFTGRENVFMAGSVLGLSHQEIEERFDDIAAFADIGDFIEQPVKTYSSGMYIRLAFAVNAHVDADILIIDEALSVGDAFFSQKCMRFLRNFIQRGTILFVSHDIGAVQSLCERAILLKEGQIELMADSKAVAEKYLENLYSQNQDVDGVRNNGNKEDAECEDEEDEFYDQRLKYINQTNLRNDLEIFRFNEQSPAFGNGGARILDVSLTDETGKNLSWVVGGEKVSLNVDIEISQPVNNAIVGFFIKDRLGQELFGDNTFLTYLGKPQTAEAGSQLKAAFEFYMPVLPMGDYSVTVAVADGSQNDHVQLNWMHDALQIRSNASSIGNGLIGVPMQKIKLEIAS
nr:ABC transporter ATP-binding protein [Nitrospinaceae bacterium]NIR56887.1 ABC transporter ATP-binding protein [Nitrospinaceae bacterium]NIT84204.1 ABC transporter ATP-binding protein [Nitrospinaceae bacterium]NIX36553.1 ATP-binding cassette domain-containing protein [Nitrospinaceae bacterium]NIY17633.1 ATP-binding cassette domain-containing protein [Nitrospinaceae bacterium]